MSPTAALALCCALALGFRIPTEPLPITEPIIVLDADTFDAGAERFRVSNLDAPEIGERARCERERVLGARATAAAQGIFASARTVVAHPERRRDRYGRVVARIEVDGADFAETMIARGLGRVWRGRSSDWCE